MRGSSSRSYGLNVARLAGIPVGILQVIVAGSLRSVELAVHAEQRVTIWKLDRVLQIAEKRALSMELATEFVQGGGGGDQFSLLLGEVMRASDVSADGGAAGLEAAARLANLQTKVGRDGHERILRCSDACCVDFRCCRCLDPRSHVTCRSIISTTHTHTRARADKSLISLIVSPT